jgi:hypothetical protein
MVIRTSQQSATALQGDRAISCPRLGILHLKQRLRRRSVLCLGLEAQPQINLSGAGAFAYVNGGPSRDLVEDRIEGMGREARAASDPESLPPARLLGRRGTSRALRGRLVPGDVRALAL